MKSVPKGELRNVVMTLRKLMSAYDDVSFVLRGRLDRIDGAAEDLAKTLRPQIHDTANGIYELLERIESLDSYVKLRQDVLRDDTSEET